MDMKKFLVALPFLILLVGCGVPNSKPFSVSCVLDKCRVEVRDSDSVVYVKTGLDPATAAKLAGELNGVTKNYIP
jgi:hypothetical protein